MKWLHSHTNACEDPSLSASHCTPSAHSLRFSDMNNTLLFIRPLFGEKNLLHLLHHTNRAGNNNMLHNNPVA